MPKVSVIIPTYNCAKYITQALGSVLNQTYKDFEVIVVDDGSMDNTKEIVHKYIQGVAPRVSGAGKEKRPTICYIYQENKGPAAARNKGIKESTGKYIAILDADDVWLPNRLEEQVSMIESDSEIGLVHANTIRIDEDNNVMGQVKRRTKFLTGRIFKYLLLREEHVSCPTVLFRKECIDKVGLFDENPICVGVEDRELWLRIARGYKIVHINKVLAYYRIRKSSVSRNPGRIAEAKSYVVNKLCPDGRYARWRKIALSRIYRELADELLYEEKFKDAQSQYLKVLYFWPYSFWAWINLIKALLRFKVRYVPQFKV